MRTYSQAELLEEGFWDKFKGAAKGAAKTVRGATRAGATIARAIAPEITDPLDEIQTGFRNVKNSFRQGKAGVEDPKLAVKNMTSDEIDREKETQEDRKLGITTRPQYNRPQNQQVKASPITQNIKDGITIGLRQRQFQIVPGYPIQQVGVGKQNAVFYKVLVQNPQAQKEWVVVDANGRDSPNQA